MAIKIPSGIEAYIVTAANDGYVTLTQIFSVIPANTGVVLRGGNIELSTDNTYFGEVEPIYGNLLRGTDCDTMIEEEAYVLGIVDGEYGFYKAEMEDGKFLNNSNKAYLPVSALSAGASQCASLRFVFGNTTAVEDLEDSDGNVNAVYDLVGRKVSNPAKGIYIVNGKKRYVK